MHTDLMQKREVFHLAFLRALTRSVPPNSLAVKGGCNLRFFFGSERYSEDVDLDVDSTSVAVHVLKDKVMSILESPGLSASLRTIGIETVLPPDLSRAKQTETVQRFKVHLLTGAGEDLSAKIEFSRRGMDAPVLAEPVLSQVLAAYRLPPLILSHYGAQAAVRQKIFALMTRRQPEARDVFDLFILSSRPEVSDLEPARTFSREELRRAVERAFSLDYERYRDTVVAFLRSEDQSVYDSSGMWDQIRLVAIALIEKGLQDEG